MNKYVELPLVTPLYETYHNQGSATAIIANNPSIRNWYLNNAVNLVCNRKFLRGYTSPEVDVQYSSWTALPYIEEKWYYMKYLNGHINSVIKNLIDDGYYVFYSGIDDYYVKGKSWYKEKHFNHDGMICGYNREDSTFCIYAYDSNWKYQKFWTTQKSFDAGRRAAFKQGVYGCINGIKPKNDSVRFSATVALKKIEEYLDSNIDKYPEDGEDLVYGIVVHDYIIKYLNMLIDGSIPYERMDRRIFRLIWEHKKVMLERIQCVEKSRELGNEISILYAPLISIADDMRMMYASYHRRRRDSILTVINGKLLLLKEKERALLEELLKRTQGGAK